jgi:ankyrin repeat protein
MGRISDWKNIASHLNFTETLLQCHEQTTLLSPIPVSTVNCVKFFNWLLELWLSFMLKTSVSAASRGRGPCGLILQDQGLKSCEQDMDMVQAILDYVFTLDDGIELVLHQDNNGYGALHEAVSGGKTAVMEKLIQVPGGAAFLHQQTKEWKDTPLHLATVTAKLDSIRTLIQLGADTAAARSQG